MSNLNNITGNLYSNSSSNYGITSSVRFWSCLFSNIASILCSFFVLYYLLFDRALRHALHNHIIIILLIMGLIYELTDIPLILYSDRWGISLISTPAIYLIWVFIYYAFYLTQIALFSWATMERHILIFHDKWVSTRKNRFLIHYLPIAGILIYCFVYYCLVYFGPFCENSFDSFIAGGVYIPCVFNNTILGTWNLLFHQVIPTFNIIIFSVSLLLRVLCQKRKLNQQIRWKKYRKMTIQLLSISILYLLFNAPWVFSFVAFQYGLSADIANILMTYTIYLYYYVVFLFPFVCCGTLPELQTKLKQKIPCWPKGRQVMPTGNVPNGGKR